MMAWAMVSPMALPRCWLCGRCRSGRNGRRVGQLLWGRTFAGAGHRDPALVVVWRGGDADFAPLPVSEALSSSAKHLGQLCEHLAATYTRYPGIDPSSATKSVPATDQAQTMPPGQESWSRRVRSRAETARAGSRA